MESKVTDHISRAVAIEKLCDNCDACEGDKNCCTEYRFLMSLPAADVAEVVTCGECKHRHDKNRQGCQGRRADWFCADGERREMG